MGPIRNSETLKIPAGVTVTTDGRVVTVKGPRGTLVEDMRHMQQNFRVEGKGTRFVVSRFFGGGIEKSCIQTALSTVKNMINGVTKGFRIKMRFAYAHFPINVTIEGTSVEIRNFLGEKRVRRHTVPKSVKVYRTDNAQVKDELVLEGNDLKEVSQSAATIHQLCLVKKKDIRKFLDGIYVQSKGFCTDDE